MGLLEGIVLGLAQGITEFLPVSSSGHLVVVPALLGWSEPSVTFDVVLHVATLCAVCVYFRSDLGALAAGLIGRGADPAGARQLLWFLMIATVPAAIAGYLLSDEFESLFDDPLAVCGFWVVTAVMLLVAEHVIEHRALVATLTTRRAVMIGAAQAVAITPGISRSGATIATGLGTGLTRESAARFSFLLAIPVIAGAALSRVPDFVDGSATLDAAMVGGFLAATVSGYFAIAVMLRYVQNHSLRVFAYYLLGAAVVCGSVLILR